MRPLTRDTTIRLLSIALNITWNKSQAVNNVFPLFALSFSPHSWLINMHEIRVCRCQIPKHDEPMLHSLTLWTEIRCPRGCSRQGNRVPRWGSGCWTSGEGYERTNNTAWVLLPRNRVNTCWKQCERNAFWGRTTSISATSRNMWEHLEAWVMSCQEKRMYALSRMLRLLCDVYTVTCLQRCLALEHYLLPMLMLLALNIKWYKLRWKSSVGIKKRLI